MGVHVSVRICGYRNKEYENTYGYNKLHVILTENDNKITEVDIEGKKDVQYKIYSGNPLPNQLYKARAYRIITKDNKKYTIAGEGSVYYGWAILSDAFLNIDIWLDVVEGEQTQGPSTSQPWWQGISDAFGSFGNWLQQGLGWFGNWASSPFKDFGSFIMNLLIIVIILIIIIAIIYIIVKYYLKSKEERMAEKQMKIQMLQSFLSAGKEGALDIAKILPMIV